MSDQNGTNGGGIGFFGLLTILFVGLKLTGFITWSWWWVWSPMLIVAAIWAICVLIVVIAAATK